MVQLASPVLLPGLWFGWKGFVVIYLDGYMIENRRSIFLPSPVLDLLSLRPGLRGYMTQLYFRSPSLKMVGVEISLLTHSWAHLNCNLPLFKTIIPGLFVRLLPHLPWLRLLIPECNNNNNSNKTSGLSHVRQEVLLMLNSSCCFRPKDAWDSNSFEVILKLTNMWMVSPLSRIWFLASLSADPWSEPLLSSSVTALTPTVSWQPGCSVHLSYSPSHIDWICVHSLRYPVFPLGFPSATNFPVIFPI